MAKHIFLFIVLIASVPGLAQVNYQKGYFIDNSDKKLECYIKDNDWLNIPDKFSYRLYPDSEERSISISEVKEFKAGDNKYVRAQVNIDNSSGDARKISSFRRPQFTNETLFLKVLVEGKSNLYYFRRTGEDRYFFSKDTSSISQLIYKRYVISNTQTGVNRDFQNQLKIAMNCRNYPDGKFQSLKYDRNVLEDFFLDYNRCMGDTTQTTVRGKSILHFKITPGIDFASLEAQTLQSTAFATFEPKVRFRLGAEFEMVLPFAKNKWAVISEPTYQSYKSTSDTRAKKTVNYQSIELSLGPRHYFFFKARQSNFYHGSCHPRCSDKIRSSCSYCYL